MLEIAARIERSRNVRVKAQRDCLSASRTSSAMRSSIVFMTNGGSGSESSSEMLASESRSPKVLEKVPCASMMSIGGLRHGTMSHKAT